MPYGLGYGLRYGLGYELEYGIGYVLRYGLGYGLGYFFYLKTSKLYYIFTSKIIYDTNALARDHVNNFWDTSTPICQTESLTGIYTGPELGYGLWYGLGKGCPTRGPLDKLVRPFSLLSSFTLFYGQKKFLRRKNISGEADLVERGRKNIEREKILAGIAGKMKFSKKKVIKK